MGVLATTTSTIESILGTIDTLATTASDTIEIGGSYIQKTRSRQRIDYALEMANYQTNALMLASQSQQELEARVMTEVSTTPEQRAHYDRIHDRLSKLFSPA